MGVPATFICEALETGLPGWASRIRTEESGRELPDWICVTTSPEVGASPAAETRRVRAAYTDLQLRPIPQAILARRAALYFPLPTPT